MPGGVRRGDGGWDGRPQRPLSTSLSGAFAWGDEGRPRSVDWGSKQDQYHRSRSGSAAGRDVYRRKWGFDDTNDDEYELGPMEGDDSFGNH
jgi:hypothetical protein